MDLAREPKLNLGRINVSPATREVTFPSGRDVLEPRVMQVLVILARAKGEVVSRDALIEACWDGRVVSDDAINRVIARVRKVAELTHVEDFSLETIAKVGYRLVVKETQPAPAETAPASVSLLASTQGTTPAPADAPTPPWWLMGRKALLAGTAALLLRRSVC